MEQRKSIAGPVVAIAVGAVAALVAVFGLIGAFVAASDPYGDTASTAGNFGGVVILGVVAVAALTFGIRSLIQIQRPTGR